ncbi:hypothetical protein DEO72_LG3g679 [Vigna unguiculata]|uniref:Uncharacterized protein n=1 Tax=Vigna unguiculata TaxID=3917 RepID=A0A4D6LC72_VIGUN|nr:hypothetical protein DEO72_LG3g679 [Vigna unguiculata]
MNLPAHILTCSPPSMNLPAHGTTSPDPSPHQRVKQHTQAHTCNKYRLTQPKRRQAKIQCRPLGRTPLPLEATSFQTLYFEVYRLTEHTLPPRATLCRNLPVAPIALRSHPCRQALYH